ncbi:hypothetical protein [Actinophytocola glycyrrhizae]|uniref:Uncharacterized protein n=1 Tax=Actinophytocola glycyrrhizae TaxID=2044873 RepID=A0ABV9RVK4_9PSEU
MLAGLALTFGMTQVSASATTMPDTSAPSGHVVLGAVDESSSRDLAIYGSNETAYTTDANPGGRGVFEHYGEHLKACDIQGDGNRAVAYLYWVEGGYEHLAWQHDADGANGNCKDNNLSIGEGVYVELQVCLRDGANGADKWCSSWQGATA